MSISQPTPHQPIQTAAQPRTMFEKVWQQHIVAEPAGEPTLLYVDLHLVHEVTSPQAFEGLRLAGRQLRRPDRHLATVDHNVPTTSVADRLLIADQISARQVDALRRNCADFGIEFFDVQSASQGIVHMIGPELGATKPGMTIVCGDSHTATHGAFGALAFGIGTSEVEHVMATQTLPQDKPKTFRITVDGDLPFGVTAKDIILEIIGRIGTDGATGYVVEYAGSTIRALSMEGRMTVCNMSIEAGARAGMIAPDETTFAYLKGRRFSPSGPLHNAASAQGASVASESVINPNDIPMPSNELSSRPEQSGVERSASPTAALHMSSRPEQSGVERHASPTAALHVSSRPEQSGVERSASPTAALHVSSRPEQSEVERPASPTAALHMSSRPEQSGVERHASPTTALHVSSRPEQSGVERPASPTTGHNDAWEHAVAHWRTLPSDPGAIFDRELHIDATTLAPRVTWGTSPGMVTSIDGKVPSVDDALSDADRKSFARALDYMALTPGTLISEIAVDAVFLGSCTNARIEDLRAAAGVVRGHHVATTVRAMVVPGSQQVKAQAEQEGLADLFRDAGFEWREPGCSMCLGMNPDILQPGERCASTSNRNFEGRQGRGGRTHLLSPVMAAAAAITGHLTDVRTWPFHDQPHTTPEPIAHTAGRPDATTTAPTANLDLNQILVDGGSH